MSPKVRRIRVVPGLSFPPEMGENDNTRRETSRLPVPAETPLPSQEPTTANESDASQGVYVISVTARILHMHPQTLRKYERLGLVHPSRSGGMVRYYSDQDINRLRMIKYLVEERGMNLAGVELALEMVSRLQVMRQIMAAQIATEARAAIENQMASVLEMLHYAEQSQHPVERPPQP